MIRMVLIAVLAMALGFLAGCASTGSSVVPVYATMKLIERGAVDAQDVIERTARVEAVLAEGIQLGALGDVVRQATGYHDMLPSDRYLVDTILGDVAHRLQLEYDVPLSAEHVAAIRDVLWTIQAAARAY